MINFLARYTLLIALLLAVDARFAQAQETKSLMTVEKVFIRANAIRMPVGFFAVVRDGDKYCAVKFTETKKIGREEHECYAKYEAYYQDDGTGSLLNKNARYYDDELSEREPFSIIGKFPSIARGNTMIYCGDMAIQTSGYVNSGWLYFRHHDDDLSIAPTNAREISEVDIFDGKLKWYRYDAERKDVDMPISLGRANTDQSRIEFEALYSVKF